MEPVPTAPDAVPHPQPRGAGRQAYDSVFAESEALADDDVMPVNLDVALAAVMVIGCLPRIMAMRDQVLAETPAVDIRHFDMLGVYASAAAQSHANVVVASAPAEVTGPWIEQLTAKRDVYVSDVTALSKHGLVDGERVNALRNPNGHKNVALDIIALVALFMDHWPVIEGKTGTTLDDLAESEDLAWKLVTALGEKEQGAALVSMATRSRARMYTLFARTYENVRRVVSFLRWFEGDADLIAPSLHAKKGGGKKRADGSEDQGETPSPAAPGEAPIVAPTAPVTGVPVTPAAPTFGAANGASNGSHGAADPAPGMPGNRPFIR